MYGMVWYGMARARARVCVCVCVWWGGGAMWIWGWEGFCEAIDTFGGWEWVRALPRLHEVYLQHWLGLGFRVRVRVSRAHLHQNHTRKTLGIGIRFLIHSLTSWAPWVGKVLSGPSAILSSHWVRYLWGQDNGFNLRDSESCTKRIWAKNVTNR